MGLGSKLKYFKVRNNSAHIPNTKRKSGQHRERRVRGPNILPVYNLSARNETALYIGCGRETMEISLIH